MIAVELRRRFKSSKGDLAAIFNQGAASLSAEQAAEEEIVSSE